MKNIIHQFQFQLHTENNLVKENLHNSVIEFVSFPFIVGSGSVLNVGRYMPMPFAVHNCHISASQNSIQICNETNDSFKSTALIPKIAIQLITMGLKKKRDFAAKSGGCCCCWQHSLQKRNNKDVQNKIIKKTANF
jgi:hypothetical protein